MSKRGKSGARTRGAMRVYPHAKSQLLAAIHQQQSGNLTTANQLFNGLVNVYPNDAVIWVHYGNLLWQLNKPLEAERCYRKAVDLQPRYVEALVNLGAAKWALDSQDEALACYKKAIKLDSKNVEAYHNLGGAYYQQGKGIEAIKAFQTALRIQPKHVRTYKHLGNAYHEQGYFQEALQCYEKVVQLAPSGGAKIRALTILPVIPESIQQIRKVRGRLDENLNRMLSENIYVDDPIQENGYTNFFLAYHGEDDRPLQEKYAQLYMQSCPALGFVAPHCNNYTQSAAGRRIKVGFISRNFANHSIGNTSKGIIALLSREQFEVTALFLSPPNDETAQFIAKHADQRL